ncbi:MAG TPA: FlgD immunoglobulin-like domain containing protein, partial [Bacteroidia bacterium]
KAGSKIVMQIHYPVGTAGQKDSTQLRLYFYPTTATGVRNVYVTTPLQNWSMAMPPNVVSTFTAKYPSSGGLTAPLSIYSTFPHSHLLCKTMLVNADNGTTTIPLIRINKWDFNWQGFYTFPNLVKIPAGYTLKATHTYDNTTANPNNPNNPPQTVTAGTSTGNEMLFDSFQYLLYQAGDENIDIGGLFSNDTLLNPTATSVNEISNTSVSSYSYPNPFNDFVKISYELTRPDNISISIYDIVGNEIRNIVSQYSAAGAYSAVWDGKNENGEKVQSGIYFYTIRAGKSRSSGKIVMMTK